jgi:hypothetical protein
MNSPTRITALAAVFIFGLTPFASAFYLESPDHPAAWYDRSSYKVFQQLAWENSKQVLVLYVSYSNTPVIRQQDLLSYDTFRLSFPDVHLDRSTGILSCVDEKGVRIDIGHLSSGFLGGKVVLDPEIEAVAHRDASVVHAALQSSGH